MPSFNGSKPASDASSRAKRANKRANTRHECALRKALWKLGLRFRKNVSALAGKPDIVFVGAKVVVFCDGDFWHGRHWTRLKKKLNRGANPGYWVAKITTNRERDRRVTRQLQELGWRVIRVWETEITSNPDRVAQHVRKIVRLNLKSHASHA